MTRSRNSPSPTRFASSEKSHLLEGLLVAVGGREDVGRKVDLGRRSDVGDRVDVGTPIVDDGTGSVGRFSCSCLQLEPGDFSFLFSLARSFAAIVINTIPTIKKTNAIASTASVMIRALEYLFPKVVSGASKIIISVLLEGSMIGKTGSRSADASCHARLVPGRSLFSPQLALVLEIRL